MKNNKLRDYEIELIIEYANCSMNGSEVARNLYMSRTSIDYRLYAIYNKTGLNPKNFYDLSKLLKLYCNKK